MGLRDRITSKAFDPENNPQIQLMAGQMAAIERDLHSAIQEHYAAIGVDEPDDLMPAEERIGQIQKLVGASMNGNHWAFFVEELAPEEFENAEKAKKHAGKALDEWHETIEKWADHLREQLEDVDDVDDRDLADRYVQQRFGISLEVFEAAVVNWSPGRTMEAAVRGPINADIARLQAMTSALEGREVDGPDGDDLDDEQGPVDGTD